MVSSGYQHINNRIDPERSDFPTPMQIDTGFQAISAALPIAFYAGLSKLTQQPGAKLYPMLSRRLPIPQTIAVASVAFVLGPIACVSLDKVSAPLIELCHNVTEDVSGPPKKGTEIVPTIKDRTSSDDVATASVEQVPPPRDKPLQVSIGTEMAPLMEAAVPGSVTILHPLAEEIFFRGQLFGRLVPSLGRIPAALMSSVLFGVFHRGSDQGKYFPIAEAMLGLACSLLYFRTGRLLVPFAFHSGFNVGFVVISAISSCPTTLVNKHVCAMDPVEWPVNPPELSFWERRVAKNWSFISICLVELASTFNDKAASHDASFLPLDFLGTSEMPAKESIFYDDQHGGLLKAPSLCNADGTPSNFANFLIEAAVDQLFGDEDSIAVDRLVQYSMLEQRLQFALHILATKPAHAESSGLLQLAMNSSPVELAYKLKIKDWVDQGHLEHILEVFYQEAGCMLLEFPLENLTRSEYTNVYKKVFADCLRMGLYAELNRELFIVYCLGEGSGVLDSSSIPELLSGYCVLAAAIQKKQPELYSEWAKKHKERTQDSGP